MPNLTLQGLNQLAHHSRIGMPETQLTAKHLVRGNFEILIGLRPIAYLLVAG